MKSKNKISSIIEHIREHSSELNEHEKEMLNDELLSILLFNDLNLDKFQGTQNSNAFNGLSDAEKALIKKLSDQTEQLFNVIGDDED